ncbi:hypothetical protein FDG2_0306 [Candidatus Protofrankia californiensis]|uniref:Uncharacterized protein n=1 Tax=Candidatus Protofrankia californiensis TaxID=1839754 RepID=A0A1C3NTC6_9ACTN|nr:hypothetical protein FDG2_0306 [Candidatus Protofrankia californiensis]
MMENLRRGVGRGFGVLVLAGPGTGSMGRPASRRPANTTGNT